MKKLLVLLLAAGQIVAAADFKLDFNGNLKDASGQVRGFVHGAKKVNYSGKKGEQAIILGGSQKHAVRINFGKNCLHGRVAFRFKALDWQSGDDTTNFIATFVAGTRRLMLYNLPKRNGSFFFNNQKTKFVSGGYVSRLRIEKNQWYSADIVWSPQSIICYLDGEKIATITNDGQFDGWSGVSLGTYYSWGKGMGRTLFDEFRFYESTKVTFAPPEKIMGNLASAEYNSYVVTSSVADYRSFYSDNLIDGSVKSAWRAFYPGKQWIEIFNDGVIVPDKLTLIKSNHTRGKLYRQLNGKRQLIGEFGKTGEFSFAPAAGDSFYLELTPEPGKVLETKELILNGKKQQNPPAVKKLVPITPIWYPEANNKYQINSLRFFRFEFDVADSGFVNAFLQTRSNDYFKVWINGHEADTGAYHGYARRVDKFIRKGRNLLAFECDLKNPPNGWGVGTLMAELQLNYHGKSLRFTTGEAWKCCDKLQAGWNQPGFDDSKWKRPALFPGRHQSLLTRADFSIKPVIKFSNIRLPSSLKAGDELAFSADFVLPSKHKLPFFRVDLMAANGADTYARIIPEISGNRLSFKLELPQWTPGGKNVIRIFAMAEADGQRYDTADEKLCFNVTGKEKFNKPGKARLIWHNGSPWFDFDGETQLPWCWNPNYAKFFFKRIFLYGNNNCAKLFTLHMGKRMVDEGFSDFMRAFRAFDTKARLLTAAMPDARIAIWFDLRPSVRYLDTHPQERMIEANGALGPVSYSSDDYMRCTLRVLSEMSRLLKQAPYYKNIAVMHPSSWGVSDSGIGGLSGNVYQVDRNKINVGDYNPQSIKRFRAFLRSRYRTDAALQKAWCDPEITLDNAAPQVNILRRAPRDNGALRDPAEGRMAIDYSEFLPLQHMRFYQQVFKKLKSDHPDKMVQVIYGWPVSHLAAYNVPGFWMHNGNFSFNELLDDPNVDIFTGSLNYHLRLAGSPYGSGFPHASMKLHKKLYMADADYRTFIAGPVTWGRQRSEKETRAVLRKNIAFEINNKIASWATDMLGGFAGRNAHPWNMDSSILDTRKKMSEVYRRTAAVKSRNVAQIACFSQARQAWYLDHYKGSNLMYNLVTRTLGQALNRIGAPYDLYLMDDITHKELPDHYKLYIILNAFVLSNSERQALEKLKRNGKTLLFFYAPGFINPVKGNAVQNISALTGMKTEVSDLPQHMKMRAVAGNPLHIASGYSIAAAPFGLPKSRIMHPVVYNPVFYINDPAVQVAGRYENGKTAMAVRDFKTWKSIYSTVPYLDENSLRKCAEYAGVHLYFDRPVISSVSERLIMVHNGQQKTLHTVLHLPRKSRIINADTGATLAAATDRLALAVEGISTLLLYIEPVE